MQKVRIAFYSSSGIKSKIIRWLTDSDINHVAIKYDSDDWRDEISVEAVSNGVVCHKRNRKSKYEYEVDYIYAMDHLRSIVQYLGVYYDYVGLLWFGFLLLRWKLFKIKVRKPLNDTKSQICSELVAHYFNSLPGLSIRDPQLTSPEDLLEICQKNPDLFKKSPKI